MMPRVCGATMYPVEMPDLGDPCCYGSAMSGAQGCTCWTPVYDLEQQPPQLTRQIRDLVVPAFPRVRHVPCVDCAYRGGSPERRGDPDYAGAGDDQLDQLVRDGDPFYCHQGIRKPVSYRHPSGAEVAGHPASYDPPIVEVAGQRAPFKADGTPADLCAGWASRRLRFLFRETLAKR